MQDIERFLAANPEIKSADNVPEEVWQAIAESGGSLSLTAAYANYELKQARAELDQLRMQLKAEQKNSANRQQSTGRMNGVGDSGMDEFARILLG